MKNTNKPRNIIDTRKIHEEKRRGIERIFPEKTELKLIDDNPHDFLLSEHSKDVFFHWSAPEFETFERDKKWYSLSAGFLFVVIAWAIWSDSPIMAITFILIGVVGYIYLGKKPRIIDFFITRDGIIADREIFDFDNIDSFWIFYEPEGLCALSLHTKSAFLPRVHIPIHGQDPVKIREVLLKYIPEEKHEPGILETFERVLKI